MIQNTQLKPFRRAVYNNLDEISHACLLLGPDAQFGSLRLIRSFVFVTYIVVSELQMSLGDFLLFNSLSR